MSKIFEFNSVDELKDKVEGKDLYMSIEVYTQIKKAFYSKVKRKKVIAFSAKVKQHDILDFELARDQWGKSLNTCLEVFANNNMFEECIEIQKIIKDL